MVKTSVDWVFLSPHFDDAVFSCGGMIHALAKKDARITILTIFAGEPPPVDLPAFARQIHARWGSGRDAVNLRREEDRLACARLGAKTLYFDLPDCIYRCLPTDGSPLIQSEADLFRLPHDREAELVEQLARRLEITFQPNDRVVCPLSIGGHLDHRLTRAAAQRAFKQMWFYADYPYTAMQAVNLADWVADSPPPFKQVIGSEGLKAWQDACAAYTSQVSSFWANEGAMRASLEAYWQQGGGSRLWQPRTRLI